MKFTKALSMYSIAALLTLTFVLAVTLAPSAYALSGTKPPPRFCIAVESESEISRPFLCQGCTQTTELAGSLWGIGVPAPDDPPPVENVA